VFLGALQKCAGVAVQYDKRVYDRDGNHLRKTTFYRFAPMQQSAALRWSDNGPAQFARAA
jgi:hypothetical protein